MPAGSAGPVFDVEIALRAVGGDRELLKEIIDVYFVECPRWMAEIGAAVARGEAPTLRRMAHTLKGTVSGFGAAEACALAQRLEDMGHGGCLQGGQEACVALAEALARLEPALAAFREMRRSPSNSAQPCLAQGIEGTQPPRSS
jgi:HPt (histidine-containing phosphotransfer) domain-containing protein